MSPRRAAQSPGARSARTSVATAKSIARTSSGPRAHRASARRDNHPWLLRYRKDMDVRRKSIGVVKRADANEADLVARAAVVAPKRNSTSWAANDLLSLAAVRRRIDHLRRAAQEND